MTKKSLFHNRAFYGWLAVAVLFLSTLLSFVNNSSANASSESYSYASSGSKISGKGGLFTSTAVFTRGVADPAGNYTYSGSAPIKYNGKSCTIGLVITAQKNASNGIISAPSYANGIPSSGYSGQKTSPSCDQSFAASIGAFNTSISIGGGVNNPGGPTGVAETPGQREIIPTVWSTKPVSQLPTVKASLTRVGSSSVLANQTITFSSASSSGETHFTNIDPGTYSVCITPASAFTFNACQTVTKIKGQALVATFGTPESAYNKDGKTVSVTVNIHVPATVNPKPDETLGPVTISLYQSDGVTPVNPSAATSNSTKIETSKGNQPAQAWQLAAKIGNVDPGSYIVCIANTTLCSSVFTKPVNVPVNTTINVPVDQSSQFLTSDNQSTCVIDGIGWIVCPVVDFMAHIVDAAYGFVASLLTIQPLYTTGATADVYNAWSIIRNLANGAFVIVFLVIIFSQLTGRGIDNYGIKKMLPKLIVAAILVNVSYWACAVFVDLSNILGNSIYNILGQFSKNLPSNDGSLFSTDYWAGLAGGILAGTIGTGVILYVGISALLPALIAALVAIVVVFLVLTLRQALVILLIVVSPLAFVAFLLPNTEGLFKKWRELLQTLLLMYPIIAGIFGVSAFASTIVMNSASGDYRIAIQIMGALIGILPLALTPIVMKTAGGVLNKFAGSINNPNKGPFDRMRKGAQRIREDQEGKRTIRALNGGRVFGRDKYQRRAKRETISQGIKSEAGKATTQYVADEIKNNGEFRNRVAGGSRGTYMPNAPQDAMQRALDSAQFTIEKAEIEETKAANARIERATLDLSSLRDVSLGNAASGRFGDVEAGDTSAQHAAIQQIVGMGDIEGIRDLINNAHTMSESSQKALADALATNKPAFVSATALSNIRQGKAQDTNVLVQQAINAGAYSVDKLAKADKIEVALVADNASGSLVDPTAKTKLITDAQTALTDARFGANKNRANLDNVVNGRPGTY